MRKINPKEFTMAKRGTAREINRQIALTLIRTHQPVSRADVARLMETNRANVTFLVNELLAEGLVREGATSNEFRRGRKATFLYLNSRQRCAVAVDVRATRTYLLLTDMIGRQVEDIISFPTELNPARFIEDLCRRIRKVLQESSEIAACDGIGVVVPGMIDRSSSRILRAPTLGWRNVDLWQPLQNEFPDIPVHLENSGRACALSQVWNTRGEHFLNNDLVFVSVSDGVGVGVVVKGEVLRGKNNTAGEFAHTPLNIDGPPCSCGATGCWEAYISNLATLSRYFGKNLLERKPISAEMASFTVEDLITRARGGDGKAITAVHSTARYLGLGLATIVNALDPSRIYIGGEITEAWDLIEPTVQAALQERALTKEGAAALIRVVPALEHPRLRGAAALVTAPAFAAPMVA